MIKTFKYRLYPNHKQQRILNWTLETCRGLYNSCLEERRQQRITSNEQEKKLVLLKQGEHPEYKEIHSGILVDIVQRLDKAYKNFFRRVKLGQKHGYPRFKGENRFHSVTFWGNSFRLEGKYLKLSKIGNIKVKLSREIPKNSRLCNCIIKKSCGNWYACMMFEYTLLPLPDSNLEAGIDVGITKFAALSDGTFIENPRFFQSSQKDLRKIQRKLSRCKRESNNRRQVKVQLEKLSRHIANQRHDFLHKASTTLIRKFGVIAVEDLNVAGMARGFCSKQIYDASWAAFIFMLSYKAANAGRILKKVARQYTSQKCFNCKFICKENRDRDKFLCLNCGYVDHADTNAAKNILSAWIELSGDNVEVVNSCVA